MGATSTAWVRSFITIVIAISAITLVACSSTSTPITALPTTELNLPSETPVPIIPTATPTTVPAIRAGALAQEIPPSLAELENEAEREIAIRVYEILKAERAEQGLTSDLRLLQLEDALWSNRRLLGCPQTSEESEIPGYKIVFVSDNLIYEYHTGPDDELRFCSVRNVVDAENEQLLLVDFVAAELFSLAQQRLSREQDIPASRVKLTEMSRVTWPDSSLGCVAFDTTVEIQPIAVDGYRLLVNVGGESIIFHTDFESIRQCAVEDEVLPDSEQTSTPIANP